MYVATTLLVDDDGADHCRATLHGDVSGQSFIALGRLPEGSIDYPWHTERKTTMQAFLGLVARRLTTKDRCAQTQPDQGYGHAMVLCGTTTKRRAYVCHWHLRGSLHRSEQPSAMAPKPEAICTR